MTSKQASTTDKQVGPFVVRSLTVEEGLPLLFFAAEEQQEKFQTQLLLRSVTCDGKPFGAELFGSAVPFMAELVRTSMELNGFLSKSE